MKDPKPEILADKTRKSTMVYFPDLSIDDIKEALLDWITKHPERQVHPAKRN